MTSETEEKGEYGPYKQSLRKEIYQAYAKYLIEQGKAYPCFCSQEELNQIREKQEAAKIRPGYYGICAYLGALNPKTWNNCKCNGTDDSHSSPLIT